MAHGQVSGFAAAMTTVAMSLGSAVALGDLRILAANISVVRSGLGFSPGATIFVSSLATLTLAASVLGAGVLGDRFGMKRMFLGGAAGAVIFGFLGAAAPNVAVLMIARAGIGIAFAFLSGLSLAIMNAVFPPDRRAGAIARYLAAVYAFGVIPAAVGSLLAERLGWRAGLLVTPVLAIVVAAITVRYVPETPNTHRRIDFGGLTLVAVALIGLTYGISRLQSAADAGAIAPIVVGLLASVAFVWWELRCGHPALDLRIFRSPRFSAVVTAGAASSLVLGGSMVMVTFFLVGIRDLSTTAFAALLIPATLLSALAALGAGKAAKRWGSGPVVVAGLVVLAASLLVRLAFGPTTPVSVVVGVLTLTLVGGAIVQTPQATVMMSSAPVTLGGVVSAVKASVAGTSYGLGSALFSMIGIILFTRDADVRLAGTGISALQAGELLGAAGEPAAEVDPERLAQVVEHATASMLGAARTLNLAMTAIPLLAAAVVVAMFGRARRRPDQERDDSGDDARNISPVSAPQEHGQEPGLHRIVATVRAPDGPGLVVAIAQAAASTHGNIVDLQQISDPYTEEFGCRLVIDGACHTACVAEILEPLRERRGVTFELYPDEPPPEVVVCCSSTLHCVSDLVARVTTGDLACRITAIVSDKEAARELAEAAGIEFVHVPVGDVREDQEAALAAALAERNPALVVLARYMRILPAWLVEQYEGRMINIHHSTLPAFPGANPRRRAHEAGVKIIGATAHYVTAGLDEGPIIAQDIAHVGNHDLEDLVRKGEDVERMVLARAVRLHLEHRIMVFGRRTSVFD